MARIRRQFADRMVYAKAGVRQVMHRHDRPRLVVFIAGDMREEAFEGEQRFRSGDFVFRPAFFAHANIAERRGAAYSHLPLSADAVRRWVARHGWQAGTGRIDLDCHLNGDDVLGGAIPQPYGQVRPESDMARVAALLAGKAPPPLGSLAASLGLAPYELTRRFARAFGAPPNAYRRQARLQRAIGMLTESADTLAQIAQAAGFHDQSHLTIELKRETGWTPKAFLTA